MELLLGQLLHNCCCMPSNTAQMLYALSSPYLQLACAAVHSIDGIAVALISYLVTATNSIVHSDKVLQLPPLRCYRNHLQLCRMYTTLP